jgi:hypothetical protein
MGMPFPPRKMIELDPNRFKIKPYLHQLRGVSTLLRHPFYGLFWKMRLGKSKAVIDAACTLLDAGSIDTVLICCPAQVKDVWLNPDFGEIKTHAWGQGTVFHYQKKTEELLPFRLTDVRSFIVASFEFLRQEDAFSEFPKVKNLLETLRGRKVMLILDEGSALGTWNSLQTKAMMKLRYSSCVTRCVVLDGTPAGSSTLSLFPKFALIDRSVFSHVDPETKRIKYWNFWQFRGRYASVTEHRTSGGQKYQKIVGFKNLEDLTQRTKPWCEYLGQETLDMPQKVPSLLSVTLAAKTWKVYRQMRDEMLAELDSGTLAVNHAAVKGLRLAQICSGFLGGWENPDDPATTLTKEIGCEVTNIYLGWLKERLEEDPKLKTVAWCRWRPEIERLVTLLYGLRYNVAVIYGGKEENTEWLHPSSTLDESVILVGQPQAGQYGRNFSRATSVTYLSQDYNLVTRSQSEERVQAPKIRATTLLTDVLVYGPDGQKTITHDIVKVLRTGEDLARRTTDGWRKALSDE